jgi:sec-independent protein translocase protein TatA
VHFENPMSVAVLLIIVLLVLGPKRLPEVGRSLGRGIREFRDSVTGSDVPKPEQLEADTRHAETTSDR